MSLAEVDIQKYIDEEDVHSLCGLVDEFLTKGDEADRHRLFEAISNILNVWLYDFYCEKCGDPSAYPYIKGLEALKALSKKEFLVDKGEYLSFCMKHSKELGVLKDARQYAEQSEEILRKAILLQPKNDRAFFHLVQLYLYFPATDLSETENKFNKALDLINEAILFSDTFYSTKLYTLYRKEIPLSLLPRVEKERDILFSECSKKSKQDPIFSLNLSDQYRRAIGQADVSLQPRMEKELLYFLEASTSCLSSGQAFDLVQAGHTFSKMGKLFNRNDFLILSETLFGKAMTQPGAFPLIQTYLIKSMESRAAILEKNNNLQAAETLHQEIRTIYLDNWKKYIHDISYLSHATKCLLKYALSIPKDQIPKDLLENLCSMALASESRGEGYYWFPFAHLFWIYILMGKEEEAKLWIGRGYYYLNILIKDQLKNLLIETEKKCSPQIIEYIRKLVTHLDNTEDKGRWEGGPTNYKEHKEIALKDIEIWLNKNPN